MYHESSLLQVSSTQDPLRDLGNMSTNWLLELTKSTVRRLHTSIWWRCVKIFEEPVGLD